MADIFKSILTNIGLEAYAQCALNGTMLLATEIAVGDGGGTTPSFDGSEAELVNEVWRGSIESSIEDPSNNKRVIYTATIPSSEGDFWIREVGVFDSEGNMIGVMPFPPKYKTKASGSVSDTQVLEAVLEFSNVSSIVFTSTPVGYLKVFNVDQYGGLEEALTAAGAERGRLYFASETVVTNDTVIPSNLTAWFGGGSLTASTSKTVTFENMPIWDNAFIGNDIIPVWPRGSTITLNMFTQLVADANYYKQADSNWYVNYNNDTDVYSTLATDNTTKIQTALDSVNDACSLEVVGGYYTTSDIYLPKHVKGVSWSQSRLVGSDVYYSGKTNGTLTGLRFTTLILESLWGCEVSGLYTDVDLKCGKQTDDSVSTAFSLNIINNIRAEGNGITVDNTNEYINLNRFEYIDAQGTSEKPGLLLAGTGTRDMHSNLFTGDFAGTLGVLNDSETNQWNWIEPYIESGADIKGKWHVTRMQNDNVFSAQTNPDQYTAMSSYLNPRAGDHLPIADGIIRPWLNIQGDNPSYLTTNAFSGEIIGNVNEPTGLNNYFGGTTSATYTSIDINLPPFKEGFGVLNGYIYSGGSISEILGVEIFIDGVSDSNYNISNSAPMGNGWYYVSLPFRASTDMSYGSTIIRTYINQGTGTSKTIGWGNLSISRGHIGIRPTIDKDVSRLNQSITVKDYIINSGKYVKDYVYTEGGDYFTHSFVFDKPYTDITTSSIVINISLENSSGTAVYGHKMYQITNLTRYGFDLKVNYTADYGGCVGYIAHGY